MPHQYRHRVTYRRWYETSTESGNKRCTWTSRTNCYSNLCEKQLNQRTEELIAESITTDIITTYRHKNEILIQEVETVLKMLNSNKCREIANVTVQEWWNTVARSWRQKWTVCVTEFEKKIFKKNEINKERKKKPLVKYKSADNYAGRPNKWINTKR